MSVNKKILSYNSTSRGFGVNHNFIHGLKGMFLTKKDFTFTEDDIDSDDYFFDALESGDIMPLHWAQDFKDDGEGVGIADSSQRFTYKTTKGKIRHQVSFEWDLAYHQIINTYDSSDLYVIYYDDDNHLIYTEESEGIYRGFKTSRVILEDFNPITDGEKSVLSVLDIELFDTDEININGHSTQIDWMPSLIDKLFISIDIKSVGVDYLNFTAKYLSNNIDTLLSSDITITDNSNGEITGVVLNLLGGIYKANNFSAELTGGLLTINSNLYLGCEQYRVTTSVAFEVVFLIENGSDTLIEGSTEVLLIEE